MERKSTRPLFFDGGFGTYYNKISPVGGSCELGNLDDPATVLRIHREYIAAGAQAIKTNTFGANATLIANPDRLQAVIKEGWRLAEQAVEDTDVLIFADIGYIHTDEEWVQEEYLRLAQLFIECGAKHFLFETLAEFEVLTPALAAIKAKLPEAHIIVSFAVSQDGFSKKGCYYKTLVQAARQNPHVDAVGLNCICGPTHMLQLLRELEPHEKPLSAMPNAGYPASIGGRTVYRDNTNYFARRMADMAALGVTYLGGCCGTTPAHIAEMVQALSQGAEGESKAGAADKRPFAQPAVANPFAQKLGAGQRVIAVELDPPADIDLTHLISAAQQAKIAGADVITIADSPLGRTRADSMMVAAKLRREVGVEVLPHLCCRDRNQIGLKATLLGGHIEGLRNLFVVTGDPVAQTDRTGGKGVFSFHSLSLIPFVQELNSQIFSPQPYFIGAALNVNAPRFGPELERAKHKQAAGAGFFMTQPIFTPQAAQNLALARQTLEGKILAGILPVAGYRNALFLNNEVSGIEISEELLEQLKEADPQQATALSLELSINLIEQVKGYCDGFYLMTPLRRIDLILPLIKHIRSVKP